MIWWERQFKGIEPRTRDYNYVSRSVSTVKNKSSSVARATSWKGKVIKYGSHFRVGLTPHTTWANGCDLPTLAPRYGRDLIVPSISSMLILYGQRIINHQSKSFTQPFLCKEETIVPSPFNLAFFRHNCCIRWKMQGLKIVSILSHWKFAVQLFTRIQWINDNDVNSFMIFKQKLKFGVVVPVAVERSSSDASQV